MHSIDDEMVINFLNIRKLIHEDKKWGMNLPEKEFIKGMMFLTPQSYGSRVESYLKDKMNCVKNSSASNNGDLCVNNKNIEIKISILTPTNNNLNIVQIRLFHDIDYYLCVAFDMRNIASYRKYVFLLSHEDMEKETIRASAAHGTKSVNKNNQNVELRLGLICDDNDKTFERWKKTYLVDDLGDIIKYV